MYRVIVIFHLVGPVYNTLLLCMLWPDAMTSPLSRYSDTDACIRMVTRQRGLGQVATHKTPSECVGCVRSRKLGLISVIIRGQRECSKCRIGQCCFSLVSPPLCSTVTRLCGVF